MVSTDRFAPPPGLSRTAIIVLSVITLHIAALWALQSGLLRRAAEVIIPAQVLAEFLAPPAPPVVEPPPMTPAPPPPQPRPAPTRKAPLPVAKLDPLPTAQAPIGTEEPIPAPVRDAAPAPTTPAPPAPIAPPAPPAPPRIELPSSNAAYLNNPKPGYPAISRRMGEQGKVVLRVLIDAEGQPQHIELQQSSGYERLDQQALEAVRRWRFVPGKRNGIPEAMWNVVPIHFVLE